MTVRQGKLVVLVATGVILTALVVSIATAIINKGTMAGATGAPGLALLLIVMVSSWTRLRKLEAEHGPDYVPPSSKSGRVVLLVAVATAAMLAAIAIVLFAR